jgi:hypothetical protein
MYAIYDYPSDYPSNLVVRQWSTDYYGRLIEHYPAHAVVSTLEEARATIPPGFCSVDPSDRERSTVLECWV